AAPRRADYVLCFQQNQPIAVIEAKDNNHRVGDGMQQALDYAEKLDVPFAISSNGDGFLFHDRSGLFFLSPKPSRLCMPCPAPNSSGLLIANGKVSAISNSQLSSSPITTTVLAACRAITKWWPSTAP